jgi:hypothetical protein
VEEEAEAEEERFQQGGAPTIVATLGSSELLPVQPALPVPVTSPVDLADIGLSVPGSARTDVSGAPTVGSSARRNLSPQFASAVQGQPAVVPLSGPEVSGEMPQLLATRQIRPRAPVHQDAGAVEVAPTADTSAAGVPPAPLQNSTSQESIDSNVSWRELHHDYRRQAAEVVVSPRQTDPHKIRASNRCVACPGLACVAGLVRLHMRAGAEHPPWPAATLRLPQKRRPRWAKTATAEIRRAVSTAHNCCKCSRAPGLRRRWKRGVPT